MDRTEEDCEELHFVTLALDRETFALPVSAVREILDVRPLCRVPQAPPFLAGLIDVRGAAVPVIDLRIKLGMIAGETTGDTRIIVLDIAHADGRLEVGLLADRVFEVMSLMRAEIAPPPRIGRGWRSSIVEGVVRRGEAFVMLLDQERLFTADEADLLAGEDAAAPSHLAAASVTADQVQGHDIRA